MASGFHCEPEPSQRLAAHTPSGAPMLQDTGCGNNVTRVLPPCLPKSGFADCLFEGKEASDKHPVLKRCLCFVAERGDELPLRRWGETEECWREGQRLGRTRGGLWPSVCHVQFVHFKPGQWVAAIHPEGSFAVFWPRSVGPLPTVLVSSIRSCPGRPASVSPYVTHHAHRKRAIDKSDKAIFHFPFLSIVCECCARNALSTFHPRGLTLGIFQSRFPSRFKWPVDSFI